MTSNSINAVYIDQFIDVGSDNSPNVWYDYEFTSVESNDDTVSSTDNSSLTSSKPSKNKDNTKKLFICPECDSTFCSSSNLRTHMKIHTGLKPYICNICTRSFVQNSNLKAHMRIHSGERPYTCEECGKTFARSSHLIGHKRTHTGELPFSCEYCMKQFSTSSQLKKHKKKHEENSNSFFCNICDQHFQTIESLIFHQRLHNSKKPYRCVICLASFRSRDDLNIHKKLHPGDESPYTCSSCGRGFKIKLCCEKHAEKCGSGLLSESGDVSNLNQYKRTYVTNSDINEMLKLELLEECIEEGIEDEADEHTVVVTNDDGILYI